MKKGLRIASSLIMLGSAGTSGIFSASGSLDIPDATDTAGNSTPAVNPSVPPTEPPVDVTSNGQQPKAIPSKGGDIQNLMDQLSSQLKNLLLTGGPNTARWEIDRNSLVKLIKVFDPKFNPPDANATPTTSEEQPIFGIAYKDFNSSNNYFLNGMWWTGLRNNHLPPARPDSSWKDDIFPDPLPDSQ